MDQPANPGVGRLDPELLGPVVRRGEEGAGGSGGDTIVSDPDREHSLFNDVPVHILTGAGDPETDTAELKVCPVRLEPCDREELRPGEVAAA